MQKQESREVLEEVLTKRNSSVELLWNMTETLNVLHPGNWTQLAIDILNDYTRVVYKANNVSGWDVDENEPEQWSYAGSLLYSITIITTIGH